MPRFNSVFILLFSFWSASTISAPAQGPRAMQVSTAQVAEHEITRSLQLIGNARSKSAVDITSEVSGKIAHIYVSAGQEVKKGQQLLALDDAKAKASLLEARAYYNDEVRKLSEYKKLKNRGAVTKTQLDAQQASADIAKARLSAAELKVKDHTLVAPFAATVGLVDVNLGQFVSIGQSLLTLSDLSAIQLDVKVPEQYLSEFDKQIDISLTSKAWPNRIFTGKVNAVDSNVNQDSLNFRTRIDVDTQDVKIIPGMLMEATIDFDPIIVPSVPVQAIEYSGTKRFVFVVEPNNSVKRTEVKLGGRNGEYVQVESGLSLGDRIVKEGLVSIRDGMKINDVSQIPAKQATMPATKKGQE